MSSKPETTFIASVNKHLPVSLYRMKNNNPYVGGPADMWYSGNRADMWIEYKFLPRVPQRSIVKPLELLSDLQRIWLNGRAEEGRTVAIVIGCKVGGVILLPSKTWLNEIPAAEYNERLADRKTIAYWITQTTMR